MTEVWNNSIDVAMTCAAIAKILGITSVDEAYTFGLFHDSGIPLLMEKFENYTQVLKQASTATTRKVTDIENDAFGTNHSVVGYYVAKAWLLRNSQIWCMADLNQAALCCVTSVISGSMMTAMPS